MWLNLLSIKPGEVQSARGKAISFGGRLRIVGHPFRNLMIGRKGYATATQRTTPCLACDYVKRLIKRSTGRLSERPLFQRKMALPDVAKWPKSRTFPFLSDRLLELQKLIDDAKKKDTGLTEFWLAGMMRQVGKLTTLPRMLEPLDLDTIKTYFLAIADELIRDSKPPDWGA